MSERTMAQVSVSENTFSIRTISPRFKSPQRFIFLKSELGELEKKRFLVSSDSNSYATLRLSKVPGGGETMQIYFSWLNDVGNNILSGRSETMWLPYERFHQISVDDGAMDGQEWSVLSLNESYRPHIQFRSRRNLHAVAEHPLLRHKLGVFLSRSLQWHDSEEIILTDDSIPYSFFFVEKTPYGDGICGGVILHGQEDLAKAYYGIHT